MDRTEALRQEWRERLAKVLRPMLPLSLPHEDHFAKFADPGPPESVALPAYKRHNWARRLLGRP